MYTKFARLIAAASSGSSAVILVPHKHRFRLSAQPLKVWYSHVRPGPGVFKRGRSGHNGHPCRWIRHPRNQQPVYLGHPFQELSRAHQCNRAGHAIPPFTRRSYRGPSIR